MQDEAGSCVGCCCDGDSDRRQCKKHERSSAIEKSIRGSEERVLSSEKRKTPHFLVETASLLNLVVQRGLTICCTSVRSTKFVE